MKVGEIVICIHQTSRNGYKMLFDDNDNRDINQDTVS